MGDLSVGLVGLGRLGHALAKYWDQSFFDIGVYHPQEEKAKHFSSQFKKLHPIDFNALTQVEFVVLALPSNQVSQFIEKLQETCGANAPGIINMATAVFTDELRKHHPEATLYGVKFMGNAKTLNEKGNGLFISQDALPKDLNRLYEAVGRIEMGQECDVLAVNKQATRQAIEAAVKLKKNFSDASYPEAYVVEAFQSLMPEVIRSYGDGKLGHFGQEIAEELESGGEE